MYDSGRAASYIPLPETAKSTIALAFSADGEYFASTHGDHTVKVRALPPATHLSPTTVKLLTVKARRHHQSARRACATYPAVRVGGEHTSAVAWANPPAPPAPPHAGRRVAPASLRRRLWLPGFPLRDVDGGVRADRPRADAVDGQVPPAQQPAARVGIARPDGAHLGREHQGVPLPAPLRLRRLLHRIPLERRAPAPNP